MVLFFNGFDIPEY